MPKEKIQSRVEHAEVVESTIVHDYDLFKIVERNGKCIIAVTNQVVSKHQFDSVEAAKAYIDAKPWELLINTCCATWDIIYKDKMKND